MVGACCLLVVLDIFSFLMKCYYKEIDSLVEYFYVFAFGDYNVGATTFYALGCFVLIKT